MVSEWDAASKGQHGLPEHRADGGLISCPACGYAFGGEVPPLYSEGEDELSQPHLAGPDDDDDDDEEDDGYSFARALRRSFGR